jgi:hypothetical protein
MLAWERFHPSGCAVSKNAWQTGSGEIEMFYAYQNEKLVERLVAYPLFKDGQLFVM